MRGKGLFLPIPSIEESVSYARIVGPGTWAMSRDGDRAESSRKVVVFRTVVKRKVVVIVERRFEGGAG